MIEGLREKIQSFEFRSSGLGNIVTKSGKLTQGSMTYITDTFIGLKDDVRKEAYGKALEKGIATEQDIIDLINTCLYKDQFVGRVQDSKSNGWIKGTADVFHDGIIYDCKSAYDRFSFAKADLTWLYEWQLKAYCWLYGTDKARLFYGLVDMPDYLILAEQRSMFYKNSGKWLHMEDPKYLEACDELEAAHKYGDYELWERFKVWDVEFTKEDELRIVESVSQARAYMLELLDQHEQIIIKNKTLMGL